MLDVAHAVWVERLRQVDTAAAVWGAQPHNEARLLFHLGLLDELPAEAQLTDEDNPDVEVENLTWAELQQRYRDNPVTEDLDD